MSPHKRSQKQVSQSSSQKLTESLRSLAIECGHATLQIYAGSVKTKPPRKAIADRDDWCPRNLMTSCFYHHSICNSIAINAIFVATCSLHVAFLITPGLPIAKYFLQERAFLVHWLSQLDKQGMVKELGWLGLQVH